MTGPNMDYYDRRQQRNFGLVMAGAFCVLALIRWWWEAAFPPILFGIATAFLVIGLVAPRALTPVFIAWMKLAIGLNWVITYILLTVVFVLMITPVGLVRQIFAEDPLKRKWLPNAITYWEKPEGQPAEFDRYKNQF
ncbi:MAG: SxtJ family membrane protein [Candidatus Hydrogenedentota bacterium]